MELKHGCLEDYFPFLLGVFLGSMLIFQGVPTFARFLSGKRR